MKAKNTYMNETREINLIIIQRDQLAAKLALLTVTARNAMNVKFERNALFAF